MHTQSNLISSFHRNEKLTKHYSTLIQQIKSSISVVKKNTPVNLFAGQLTENSFVFFFYHCVNTQGSIQDLLFDIKLMFTLTDTWKGNNWTKCRFWQYSCMFLYFMFKNCFFDQRLTTAPLVCQRACTGTWWISQTVYLTLSEAIQGRSDYQVDWTNGSPFCNALNDTTTVITKYLSGYNLDSLQSGRPLLPLAWNSDHRFLLHPHRSHLRSRGRGCSPWWSSGGLPRWGTTLPSWPGDGSSWGTVP